MLTLRSVTYDSCAVLPLRLRLDQNVLAFVQVRGRPDCLEREARCPVSLSDAHLRLMLLSRDRDLCRLHRP